MIVIAATNYPEKIPSAAFQRFTHRIFVGLPNLDNIREIVMKKLRRMEWTRVNFMLPVEQAAVLPKWAQKIDWNRNQFITSFLDEGVREQWEYPSGDNPQNSNFYNPSATQADVDRRFLGASEVGVAFPDFFRDEDDCPWDVVDLMCIFLYNNYYAPREIDALFYMMLIDAQIRSIAFVNGNPLGISKTYYQKWILEKRIMTKKVEANGKCIPQRMERHALIPLNYSVENEGEDNNSERNFLQAYYKNETDFDKYMMKYV